MEYLIRALGFLLIPFAVSGVMIWMRRRPKNIKAGRVYMSSALLFIGIIAAAFFTAVAVFASFSNLYVSIFFLVFALFSSSLITAYFNCYIIYNDYDFTQKTFFGVKHRHKYSEITAMRLSGNNPSVPQDIIFYVGRRRVRIDGMAVGRDEFIELANQKYREKFGCDIPERAKGRNKEDDGGAKSSKLFNGHLTNPVGNIVAWIIMLVLWLSLAVTMSVLTFFPQLTNSAEPVVRDGVIIVKYELESDDVLVLTDNDGKLYEIDDISHASRGKLNSLISLCDSYTPCKFTGTELGTEARPVFAVRTVSSPEGEVLSERERYDMHIAGNMMIVIISWALFIASAALVALSAMIASHPERFNEKLIRFFYKEGTINY